MPVKKPGARIVVTMLVLAAGLFGGSAALTAGPSMPESRARAWVEAHKTDLPRSLGELAAFPDVYRKVIIDQLTPQEKARLWLEHLKVVSERPDLNDQQRAYVMTAMLAATPEFLEKPRSIPNVAGFACDMMAFLFAKSEASGLLAVSSIGRGSPKRVTLRSLRVSVGEGLRSAFSASAEVPECDCRPNYCDWCQPIFLHVCIPATEGCQSRFGGCVDEENYCLTATYCNGWCVAYEPGG